MGISLNILVENPEGKKPHWSLWVALKWNSKE
jgi:hypothetical protein